VELDKVKFTPNMRKMFLLLRSTRRCHRLGILIIDLMNKPALAERYCEG